MNLISNISESSPLCYCVNLNAAFDTADHAVLVKVLQLLPFRPYIYEIKYVGNVHVCSLLKLKLKFKKINECCLATKVMHV